MSLYKFGGQYKKLISTKTSKCVKKKISFNLKMVFPEAFLYMIYLISMPVFYLAIELYFMS